jgi:cytochrome P450
LSTLGAKLLPNLWGTHMDPKYFPEPEKFLPERFLNDDGSLKTRVEGFIPFSMGRRQCMGETFSKICMFKVLTSLIWNFKINFNDRKPRPSLEPRIGMILDPQTYDVELQLRDL